MWAESLGANCWGEALRTRECACVGFHTLPVTASMQTPS